MSSHDIRLRHRDFRLLVTGTATSALGNAITPVALAFAVLDLGGSASELGLVVAAFALTEVVTTLFGRAGRPASTPGRDAGLGDRQRGQPGGDRRVADRGLRHHLAARRPRCGHRGTVGPERALVLGHDPVDRAEGSDRVRGRTAQHGAERRSDRGYSIGGLLVAGVGPGWAIGVDATTYAVAALCYSLLRTPAPPPGGPHDSMLGELGEGLREVRRHTWLVLLIGMALLYHLVYGGAQGVLGPIVVRERFGTADWGWALSALMSGFLAGSLICLRWRPRHGLRIGTAMLSLTALFPLAIAFAHTLPLLLLGAAAHGFGLMIFDINWETSIQQHIPEDKLSRVFAFDVVGSFIARPLGLAVTGPVATLVGFSSWLVVVASVMAGASLLCLLSRDVWTLERTDARAALPVAG